MKFKKNLYIGEKVGKIKKKKKKKKKKKVAQLTFKIIFLRNKFLEEMEQNIPSQLLNLLYFSLILQERARYITCKYVHK